MTQELATRVAHLPAVTDDGFLDEVRTQIAPKASDAELRFFAQVVAKTQLDPWSRQVYLIPRWDGRVKREVHRPQVSIDGLRLIAERSGTYDGQTPVEWCGRDGEWRDTWFGDEAPAAARVGVYKNNRPHPTYAVAHYDEYVVLDKAKKPSGLWKDKPRVMLAKCAEALALRKAFPQETSGLYTAEEMGRADVEVVTAEVVDAPAKPKTKAPSTYKQEPTPAPAETVTVDAPADGPGADKIKRIMGKYGKTVDWLLIVLADLNDPDRAPLDIASINNAQTVDEKKAAIRNVLEALTLEQAILLVECMGGTAQDLVEA